MATQVTAIEASITIPDGFNNHNFTATTIKFTPIHSHKPPQLPLSFRSTLTASVQAFVTTSSKRDSIELVNDNSDCVFESINSDRIEVEIEKISKNRRRIRSKVSVDASLETIWRILTDYERLAEFIPGLVVSEVIEKKENFARLLQIGQQNLAFGLKFNAKGIVDCYEKDFESLPYGQRRDIEFKMIEGDFELFEGKWSIEQSTDGTYEQSGSVVGQRYYTTLLYTVEVEPKMWLPVQLVEGRLSREIKTNLFCIREEAQKTSDTISSGRRRKEI